jgi:hypothetical protein
MGSLATPLPSPDVSMPGAARPVRPLVAVGLLSLGTLVVVPGSSL